MDNYNYNSDPNYWTPEVIAQHESWLEQLSLDKIEINGYEILYTRHQSMTIDGEDIYMRGIEWLNGARVDPKYELKHQFNYTHEEEDNTGLFKIVDCTFVMPSEFKYIGDLFDRLPWGIIKKNKTGLGATTLELFSPRHSIVVVPTRALAYEKAKSSRIEGTNRYSILYYGGKITGFNVPSVQQYLSDSEIEYKKFIVVIDSLDRLLKELGEEHWKDYFIMFDEIDCYQYDSWFRPNMEKNFSYYFKFPFTQRCLVSATMGEFSNPEINEEPVININFESPEIKTLTLLETNEPDTSAVKQIIKISQDYPNDNILIAYNLVTKGILPIILCLPEELRNECSVLCSEKSREHVKDYYKEVIGNALPSRITFISCTYFVGIDFSDRFHLISVANKLYPFTLLSTEKLQQIVGRCRNEQGLLSHTLIFNTTNSTETPEYPNIQKQLIKDAKLLVTLSESMNEVSKTFPKLIHPFNKIFLDQFVKNSLKSYCGSSEVRCVREEEGKLKVSYFNIDNALIQIKLLHSIYVSKDKIKESLINQGFEPSESILINQEKPMPREILQYADTLKSDNDQSSLNGIIEELRLKETYEDRITLAEAKAKVGLNKVSQYLKRFIKLHEYVPFEPLITLLSLDMKEKEFNHLYNAVIFWALDNEHGIKKAWNQYFVEEEKYKSKYIASKFNEIWNGLLGLGKVPQSKAFKLAQKYLISIDDDRKRFDKPYSERAYRIVDLNPCGLPLEHNKIIPPDTNIQNMIEIL